MLVAQRAMGFVMFLCWIPSRSSTLSHSKQPPIHIAALKKKKDPRAKNGSSLKNELIWTARQINKSNVKKMQTKSTGAAETVFAVSNFIACYSAKCVLCRIQILWFSDFFGNLTAVGIFFPHIYIYILNLFQTSVLWYSECSKSFDRDLSERETWLWKTHFKSNHTCPHLTLCVYLGNDIC